MAKTCVTTCRPRQTPAEAALTLIESRCLVGMQSLANSMSQLGLLNCRLRLQRSWMDRADGDQNPLHPYTAGSKTNLSLMANE